MPQLARELADSQQRVERRLGRLEQAVVDLDDAQRRTEQRVSELYGRKPRRSVGWAASKLTTAISRACCWRSDIAGALSSFSVG